MKIDNCDWNDFGERVKRKKIYCFGAGVVSYIFMDLLAENGLLDHVLTFVDNAATKIGKRISYKDRNFDIISVGELANRIRSDVILITCSDTEGVVRQLNEMQELDDILVYSMYIMLSKNFKCSHFPGSLRRDNEMRIPKKIHYCWFGNNEMSDRDKACIQSWKKYCPDYEIIEWNESNYNIKKNRYMYEAYQSKKWGFVSDYARLDIIYEEGGIYLDVDVEMIRNIDDLLYQHAFSGFDSQLHVNLGSGFGAEPKNEFIKELRDYYDDINFLLPDGSPDLTTCMIHQQNVFDKYGLVLDDSFQTVQGMSIYPAIVLNGLEVNAFMKRREDCTCFYHHMDGSWKTDILADARKRRVQYVQKFW